MMPNPVSSSRWSSSILLLFFLLCSLRLSAQQDIRSVRTSWLDSLKLEGRMTGKEQYVNYSAQPISMPANNQRGVTIPNQSASTSCNCWLPRDASWQIGQFNGSGASGGPGVAPEYRNDDWTTPVINLPFSFCFYGTTVNQIYLNNNGNISIGAPYSTFTANTFPDPTYTMIAPFWGDVDTRGAGSGLVYYKITPTYLVVQWDQVGYFGSHDDLLNTFQLIMTDGSDPLLPPGNNVQFCYRDMQWTTGDASGGVGGFGGTPATVGVNKGNGIDYIQIGLYDQAGGAYDGPFGANDGIDMLDNQTFLFNVCISGTSNIPPLINSDQICDTLSVCENDTLLIDAVYLSPEFGQTTVPNVNPNGMAGVSTILSSSGNIATQQVQVIGQPGNVGYHTIFLEGTDNGTPAQTASAPIVIRVIPAPNANFTVSPTGPQLPGTLFTFTNASVGGFSAVWDFGDGSPPSSLYNTQHIYSIGGTYTVTLTVTSPNGCSDVFTQQVQIQQCGSASFTTSNACPGSPSLITFTGTTGVGATYNWDFAGGTVISGSGQGPYNVVWNTPGVYSVSLTVSESGCAPAATSQQVTLYDFPEAAVSASPTVCVNVDNTVNFTGTAIAGATYVWDFGNGSVVTGSGAGPYTIRWSANGNETIRVLVTQNGCSDSSTFNVLVHPIPTSTFNIPPEVCLNDSLSIAYTGSAGATATYEWDFGSGNVISGNGAGPYNVSWNTSVTPSVSLTVTENGCVSPVTTLNTLILPLPTPNAGADVADCSGTSVNIGAPPLAGETYSWSPALGLADPSSSETAVSLINLGTSNQIDRYILTVTSSNGCENQDTVDVTSFPIPAATFVRPAGQCVESNSFNFIAGGQIFPGVTYEWEFGTIASLPTSTDQNPLAVSYPAPGVYPVVLQSAYNGCIGPDFIDSVEVFSMPVASFEPLVIEGCEPLEVPFLNNSTGDIGGYSWSYFDGNSDSLANPTHVFQNAGTYSVMLSVTSNQGCRADTVLPNIINVWPKPVAGFIPNPAVTSIWEALISFDNTTIKADTYTWDFGDSTGSNQHEPSHLYDKIGAYLVTLYTTNQFGCADTISGIVRIEQGFNFYVPNAFTPNGDGINETFRGLGTSFKTYEMWIYNRWGRQLYYTNDYEKPWDGSVDVPVQNEVFTYRIRIIDIFDKDHLYLGRVSVVR